MPICKTYPWHKGNNHNHLNKPPEHHIWSSDMVFVYFCGNIVLAWPFASSVTVTSLSMSHIHYVKIQIVMVLPHRFVTKVKWVKMCKVLKLSLAHGKHLIKGNNYLADWFWVILTGIQWYLTVVLICISLKDYWWWASLHVHISNLYFFLGEMTLQFFCPLGGLPSYCWVLRALYVICTRCICQV